MSEFALLVEYPIISKMLYLIKGEKILENSDLVNNAVYKYIRRIVDFLKAEWIFF